MRGRLPGDGSLKKVGKRWVLDYTDEVGKRRRRVLSSDKRTAEQLRREILRRRDLAHGGLENLAGQELRLAEIQVDYLADLQQRVSPAYVRNVRSILGRTLEAVGDVTVRELRSMDVIRFRTRLKTEGLSNRTANLHTDCLRAMLRWAVEMELIAKNPIGGLKRLPEGKAHQRVKRRSLTEEEVVRYLAAVAEDDDQCDVLADDLRVPQLPLFEALLSTGGRWNEVRQLTWGAVDLDGRTVVFRPEDTKSEKQRSIPISPALAESLHRLKVLQETLLRRLPTVRDRVFLTPRGQQWAKATTNVMRIHDRVLRRAGIPKVDVEGQKIDIHALRHTSATRFARAGVPMPKTQKLLGHARIETTATIYTHLDTDDLRDAVDAVERMSARHRAQKGRHAQ